jgi:hypothetical protein
MNPSIHRGTRAYWRMQTLLTNRTLMHRSTKPSPSPLREQKRRLWGVLEAYDEEVNGVVRR